MTSLERDGEIEQAHHRTTAEPGALLVGFGGTLRRYAAFVAAIARTDFFDPGAYSDDGACRDLSGEQWQHSQAAGGCRISVLSAVFPPAFVKYALATAVADVLRYALLVSTVGVPRSDLPLVVGVCDATCAVVDVLLRLQGSWDMIKAGVVGSMVGPLTAAVIYCAGVVIVTLSAVGLGCGASAEKSASRGASRGDHEMCITYIHALALYTIGSYLMRMGHGLLWNVWTQTFKPYADRRLVEAEVLSESETSRREVGSEEFTGGNPRMICADLDIQGKLSQIQVLLRYAASSIAPPCAAYLLFFTKESPTISYCAIGLCFLLLCCSVSKLVTWIQEDTGINAGAAQGRRTSSGIGGVHRVSWSEMLPAWMTSCLRRPAHSAGEASPLILSDAARAYPGRFSSAFFHLGPFVSLTEVVRGGYTRILCLRAATSNLSHTELSRALSVVGAVALSTFWLSDLADTNRKFAATLSFAILAAGHFMLASSSSMFGFIFSAAVFGLGEGASTGLRALLKQDYLHEKGPLGECTGCDPAGRRLRRQVCNKIGIWSDVTLIANSLVVGVLGHFFGMRSASCAFGLIGVYATHFCFRKLPDTKPNI